MLLERTEQIAGELRLMGRRAIAQANGAGVAAYFMDPEIGEGIIRQLPDGTLERVKVLPNSEVVVIERLERRG